MHSKATTLLLALLSLTGFLHVGNAAFTLKIKAGLLKDAQGNAMSSSGVVVVVASTTNQHFSGPIEDAFVQNDDVVLYKNNLSETNIDGVFITTISNATFDGVLTPGDRVALYWYPTLSLNDTKIPAGTPYGVYAPNAGEEADDSAPWITPIDSGTLTLALTTTDSNVPTLTNGSIPAQATRANQTVTATPDDEDPGTDEDTPYLLVSDTALAEMFWYRNEWLGSYLGQNAPWYFHNGLGFIFVTRDRSDDSLWFWDTKMGWLWTNRDAWPNLYSKNSGHWFYYQTSSKSPRWFYNLNNGNWVSN